MIVNLYILCIKKCKMVIIYLYVNFFSIVEGLVEIKLF